MSWLKEIVRAGISTRSKRDVKANVWEKCPECGTMIYNKDLAENIGVCAKCNYHLPISLNDRLTHLLDEGAEEVSVQNMPTDPLKFKDRRTYSDRLKEAQKKTEDKDACRVLNARINGEKVVVCAFNFAFMAGSMGAQVGEAIVRAAEEAKKNKCGLLIIPASGGARMQEGIISLMQMARSTAALIELKEAGLPYIVLLTNPTTGGVTASFAMEGDFHLAEPGALIGFAGPRVIQQTIGETLPEGFQKAEYLLEHGMIDMVAPRNRQKELISGILKTLRH